MVCCWFLKKAQINVGVELICYWVSFKGGSKFQFEVVKTKTLKILYVKKKKNPIVRGFIEPLEYYVVPPLIGEPHDTNTLILQCVIHIY